MLGGGIPFLAPLVALPALVVVIVTVLQRRRRNAADERRHPVLTGVRLASTVVTLVGILLGLIASIVLAVSEPAWNGLGRGVILAPLLFGAVVLAVIVAGNIVVRWLVSRRAERPVAAGSRRRPGFGALIPRTLAAVVAGLTLTTFVMVAIAWMTGADDDRGRPGRSFTTLSPDQMHGTSSGPWPGEFYGIFAILGMVVLLAVLAFALLVVRFRAPAGSDLESPQVDAMGRRREAEALFGATGLSIAMLVFGIAGSMAAILLRVRPDARISGYELGLGYDLAGAAALFVAFVAVGVGVWCAVSMFLPTPAPAGAVGDDRRREAPEELEAGV